MRTETRNIYTFGELSDESKAKAIECARADGWGEHSWDGEWAESLKDGMKALDFEARGTVWLTTYRHPDRTTGELKGVRAYKWLVNNGIPELIKNLCPFTGLGSDESLLEPLRDFLKAPDARTIDDLANECYQSWEQGLETEQEHANSDEAIAESLLANEVEFTEEGVKV